MSDSVIAAPDQAGQADQARRRNRKLIVLLFATPLVIAIIGLIAVTVGAPSDPEVKVGVPKGYQSITDPYFAYVVPASWKQNTLYSDSTGDLYYEGKAGWSGENESVQKVAPAVGQLAPTPVEAFGQTTMSPYQLTRATPVRVPGASFAYEYRMTRGGVVDATAIDAYDASTETEFWLVVHSTPAVTKTILGSLTT